MNAISRDEVEVEGVGCGRAGYDEMDADFAHGTDTARQLHHDIFARQLIIGYHCHLAPRASASSSGMRRCNCQTRRG